MTLEKIINSDQIIYYLNIRKTIYKLYDIKYP